MLIKNETGRCIKVRKCQVIATCEPCTTFTEIDEACQSGRESTQKPPRYLKFDLSHVPDEALPMFQHFFDENQYLFAESDLELGRTDLIKMSIDTGDHTPIRQRPYRIPYAQRPTVGTALDDMR